ncbi:NADH-quinone oxidoreductase subunit L [Flectobacillus major]|uniref:NADH-quinone oxidoreductase subunit L n=1 Tax=Flectobacillus major TaxID=103 RepID=UPI00041AC13C|nr:NADH-quinone oxidoreductase subunit L [Flectobacillus major]
MTPAIIIWFILLTPLAGFGISILLGKRNNALSGWIATGLSGLNLLLTIWLTQQIDIPSHFTFSWFNLGNSSISFGFLLDANAIMMLLLVNFIAILVQLFSIDYMHEDTAQYRYFGFIQLFVFSMLGIILTDNLLCMYAFWELVGLSSYLLIGFWYTKDSAVKAAKKAFLVNRVGDLGFLLGIFLVYYFWGNFSFLSLGNHPSQITPEWATLTGILLFCGCMGKSAQFPLHTWLPDAMEGPTPVSALIHAATMVAAGIFLLARIQPVFTDTAYIVIATIGCITMLLGSIYAIFQTDIKKTLAYSTISQLGLMLIGLGTATSLFHLLTHAFFKAGLFLAAGSVIHALHHAGHNQHFDAQDMRLMGGLRKKLPFTFIVFVIFAAALAGLPLFSGFLSKDAILANLYQMAELNPYFNWIGGFTFIGIVMTAFYMSRQVWLVFMGELRNEAIQANYIHEGSIKIKFPLALLAILSFGMIFSTNPFHAGHSWFWHVINPDFILAENHWIGYASIACVVLGIGLGYISRNIIFDNKVPTFDKLYDLVWVQPTLLLAQGLQYFDKQVIDQTVNSLANVQVIMAKIVMWFDSRWIDGVPNALASLTGIIGKITRSVQGGKVQLYVVAALMGLISLIVFIIY